METQELEEVGEQAHSTTQRKIGVTMAVVAALLATVTLMGHRLHTEEVVEQTKAADGWAYYQAKNGRYHMYAVDAKIAQLIGPQGADAAKEWASKGEEEHQQAVRWSIALLTGMLMLWWISFAGTAVGVAIAAMGFLRG